MVLGSEDKVVLDRFLEEAEGLDSPVMFLLHRIQEHWNMIPEDAARYIAGELDIPMTQIYFAASFYEDFSLEREGKIKIRICRGIVCHSRGSRELLDAASEILGIPPEGTTEDGRITLIGSSCIGQCDGAPAMMVNDVVHRNIDKERLASIISEIKEGS